LAPQRVADFEGAKGANFFGIPPANLATLNLMPITDDRLTDLLLHWDQLRQQGRPPAAEELCPDDPELQARLRDRIRQRERIEAMLQPSTLHAADGATAPPTIPDVPGYEILEVIGHGGMGVVYKARQKALNRTVALKTILSGPAASPAERARFLAEAEAAAGLQHPNIVQVFEVGEHGGRHFLAMEYVPGGSLAARLTGDGLDPRQAAELLLPLAEAVQHAHEHGIVHRDLKPANVLISSKFQVPSSKSGNLELGTWNLELKVADFGLAKRLDADRGQTQTGAILGSPSYMPPEQALGDARHVGPAADIYALGAILYELLTGRPPFKANTLLETLELVRTGDVVPPRHFRPRAPKDLEVICLKCLQKEPERRYPSARALADDLRHFLAGEPVSAREDGIGSQIARLVGRMDLDARVSRLGTSALWMSPIGLGSQLIVYLGWRHDPDYAYYALGALLVVVVFLVAVIVGGNQAMLREIPSAQRRHHRTVWTTHLVGCFVITFVVVWAMPHNRPEDLLVIIPLLVVLAGTTMLAQASLAGMMYPAGVVFLATAVVMALDVSLAPLEAGCLMSGNLVFQGLWLRRQAERLPKPTPSE
jgi:eukaryotic-like serine/threonine-protein kinase